MNPVTVRLFDVQRIFKSIETKFVEFESPWSMCVRLSVNNINSMIGVKNSVASRFFQKNPEIFISGCPGHLARIDASIAHDGFCKTMKLNIEDFLVDLYYLFDKSSKRKGKLLEYFEFCNQDYLAVLKHLSVRWLSLERCIERANGKFESLKSYFLSESCSDDRFIRLYQKFINPLLKPALIFQQSSIKLFIHFNLLLQHGEPSIHIRTNSMETLGRIIGSRFIRPEIMSGISSITELDLNEDSIFKENSTIFLGGTTKTELVRLLNEGDCSQQEFDLFHSAAHMYYTSAFNYIIICNAMWIDVPNRKESRWENVEFFLEQFPSFFVGIDTDKVFEEFVDYQTLWDEDIDQEAWKEAEVIDRTNEGDEEVFHCRADVL